MKYWNISIITDSFSCPNVRFITFPTKYTGCTHHSRWEFTGEKPIPECNYVHCPLSKHPIEE